MDHYLKGSKSMSRLQSSGLSQIAITPGIIVLKHRVSGVYSEEL